MTILLNMPAPTWVDLLIFGFVREAEKELSLYAYNTVPSGITKFIINYFPFKYKFGLYDEKYFKSSEENMVIQAISEESCSGYMIYADLFHCNETGLNAGIHYWSIMALQTDYWLEALKDDDDEYFTKKANCYRSNGITTIKPEKVVHQVNIHIIMMVE